MTDVPPTPHPTAVRVAIIGGGPAGLMAAEALLAHGVAADVFDAMPSLGRKFLMAGKSGLNLTHAEPFDVFLSRFGAATSALAPMLTAFPPDALRGWADGLGVETFVGTSGRVFPRDFKAAPLLRAWLRRLRAGGVRIHARHRWTGWAASGSLTFTTPTGGVDVQAEKTVLALGGASWPRLGSDAAWVPWLVGRGVSVAAFQPANCGFDVAWSDHFSARFEGQPLKGVVVSVAGQAVPGDVMVTRSGIEGGPVYGVASALRDGLIGQGRAVVSLDLLPDRRRDDIAARLARPRGKKSMATHWKRTLGLDGVKAGLLREWVSPSLFDDPKRLAMAIKALVLPVLRPRPIEEAISCAGGIGWAGVNRDLSLIALPDVFVAGEMLDWDATTGGYLLSACLATGRWAGDAVGRALSPTRGRARPSAEG